MIAATPRGNGHFEPIEVSAAARDGLSLRLRSG